MSRLRSGLIATLLGFTLLLSGCGYNDFQRLDEQTKSAWADKSLLKRLIQTCS